MKRNIVKSLGVMTLCFSGLAGLLSSCTSDEFVANNGHVTHREEFSFETSNEVNLEINYGPLAGRALVLGYSENPLANSTAEDESPKGTPIFSVFLDNDGTYSGPVDLPAHVKELYLYTTSMAAPQLVGTELKGGRISVNRNNLATRSAHHTRAVSDDQLVVRKLTAGENGGSATNFYTIVGGWDAYGKIEDPNGLSDEGALTSDDVLSIEHYFWMGATSKPSGTPTPERKKRIDGMLVDNVNMVVQESYEENGETYDVESAQVWFTFLTEYAWNENTVGYYYFDTNNPPRTPEEITRKFIILPNTSKPDHYPFDQTRTDYVYPISNTPVHTNQRVQLVYVDEATGKATVNFPPNIEIGFFLISNGFKFGSYLDNDMVVNGKTYKIRKVGRVNTTGLTYYSNMAFNGGDQRYVACRLQNGTVVYGCEDGSDRSFDDMMFTITASPNKAIHTNAGSELTSIPQQTIGRTYTDASERYTYAFEDLWPDGGDYDLNDVIVRHDRKITYDQFNDVSKVVDEFTFDINRYTEDMDAFAVQVPSSHKGDGFVLPAGAWFEEETGTFFLTDDVHKVNKKTLVLERTFSHPLSFTEVQNELNPFIVNQSKGVDCKLPGRVEIHLPMGEVTSKGMHIDNVKNPAKAWYISEDGQYPYALKIKDHNFIPCEEKVRIGSMQGAYLDFVAWVQSLGKEKKDWYKNK